MRILICCKDRQCCKNLVRLIQLMEWKEETFIETYSTFPMSQRKYDLAFLDLRIDGQKAFGTGKKLYMMNHCMSLYMYDDYSYLHEFFDANGFQYLLKNEDELVIDELNRAHECYLAMQCKVVLKMTDQKMVFHPCNIQYIEHYKDYMKIVTDHHRYEGFIDDYETIKKHLKKHYFIQVHPHYYVNANDIMEYKSHEIRMKNSDFLPTTLRNSDIMRAVMEAFGDSYLKK